MPTGFEKILKRTRKGITHESKEKPQASKDEADNKDDDDKKAKEKEADDREAESDAEQEDDKKKDKKEKKEEGGWGQKLYGYFMEPNGGGPNYENWFKLVVLGGLIGYYTMFSKKPSQELTYMDFVQNYLAQNKVEMITLCEEKNNASYKYRAVIDTFDGQRVHLVLPQVENFLMKLDMA